MTTTDGAGAERRRAVLLAAASPSFCKNRTLREELSASFPRARFNDSGVKLREAALTSFIGEAEGLVVGLEPVDAGLLDACPRLTVVAKFGVGVDNIEIATCRARGVSVLWSPGVNRLSVAEMTLGFMLCLCRNLYRSSLKLRAGTFEKDGGFELSGKTVGVIGAGHIGKEVVRLLKPFGCRVLVNDIIDQRAFYEAERLEEVTKEELFSRSDIVTIHTPLTDLTRFMVNRSSLSMMKPSAFLINTARGAIVRKGDLKWALETGVIAGAAVDVYEEEPPGDAAYLALPNLFCTPHVGGSSREAILAMGRSAIGHLIRHFET